jgi:hypothetical protein
MCAVVILSACTSPSLQNNGGTKLTLTAPEGSSQSSTVEVLTQRFKKLIPYPETIVPFMSGNIVEIALVEYKDTTTIRQLSTWRRDLLLVYAVPKSQQSEMREYLDAYLTYSDKEEPFKSSSMIGLVDSEQKSDVSKAISSENFRTMFPCVGIAYWGNVKVDGKEALFLSDKTSPYIDTDMFESVEPFADKEGIEGILSLKLLPDYSERIGQLTGNDSTYLLHILRDEVYISKIIEPHITNPSFSMSGAFSPQDALVISTLWNSGKLEDKVIINSMDLHNPE